MFDHYTLRELQYLLNCHRDTVGNLSRIGPGFHLMEIQRGKMRGYVVSKESLFAWADAVRRDEALTAWAKKRAPRICFERIEEERDKWVRNHAEIRRVRSAHEKRPYWAGMQKTIENGRNTHGIQEA